MGDDFTPDYLEPGMAPEEHAALVGLGARLLADRPVPRAAFRSQAAQRIRGTAVPRPRPRRLRLLIAAHALAGTCLLLFAGASTAGIGPLAA